jgi:serine/threonine protein kinase
MFAGKTSLKANASQSLVGKLLNGRYQVIRLLGTGAFGQIYLVEDIQQAGNPRYALKHLQPRDITPESRQLSRRLFGREADILGELGDCEQIPQLLDRFEDERGFYLVQEWIVGEPLSTELPLSQQDDKRWSERQCLDLLRDLVGILVGVHRHGIIHGDLKPNNLLRRHCDGKLVLIDFGSAHRFDASCQSFPPKASGATSPSGYLPPEQLEGYPQPSSDLYALGAIAIQALTGIHPTQFPSDPETGELRWQQQVFLNEALACLLGRMVCRNVCDRYQSAGDIQEVLQMLRLPGTPPDEPALEPWEYWLAEMPVRNLRKFPIESPLVGASVRKSSVTTPPLPETAEGESVALAAYAREFASACWPKLPPILAGMGAGMATSNALAISLGMYSLFHSPPANPGLDLLVRATERYQGGDFEEAIALAEAVSSDSAAHAEAVATARQWRREWHQAKTHVQAAELAAREQRWRDVLSQARKVPDLAVWQQKLQPLVEAASAQVEQEAQGLLRQAYDRAIEKDFTGAIALLNQIPPETPTGRKIQPKLAEYRQKQEIKADALLQKAYDRAAKREFQEALEYLAQIPQQTAAFDKARVKMAEYSQKQHFREEVEREVELARAAVDATRRYSEPFRRESFTRSDPTEASSALNPGSHLQEASP